MPGRAPKPPSERRNRRKPALGEFQAKTVTGWQHGDVPDPPDGLMEQSRQTWVLWFGAWWAAHWEPADVPQLRMTITLFDELERGITKKAQDRAQLHTWLRAYGITPDGQLANRWARPKSIEEPEPSQPTGKARRASQSVDHYAHLKVVGE